MNTDQVSTATQAEPIGRWPLSEPFPAMLCDLDLRRVTGYSNGQFYALKAKGAFRFLEARPQLAGTSRTFYSGHLVRQWSRGELGSSKYFQSASQRRATVVPTTGRRPGRPRKSVSDVHVQQSSELAGSALLKEVESGRIG